MRSCCSFCVPSTSSDMRRPSMVMASISWMPCVDPSMSVFDTYDILAVRAKLDQLRRKWWLQGSDVSGTADEVVYPYHGIRRNFFEEFLSGEGTRSRRSVYRVHVSGVRLSVFGMRRALKWMRGFLRDAERWLALYAVQDRITYPPIQS